jgi:hypothetical protein
MSRPRWPSSSRPPGAPDGHLPHGRRALPCPRWPPPSQSARRRISPSLRRPAPSRQERRRALPPLRRPSPLRPTCCRYPPPHRHPSPLRQEHRRVPGDPPLCGQHTAAVAAPPAAPFPTTSAVSALARPIAAPDAPKGHAFVITTALPPPPGGPHPRRPNPPPSRPPLAPTGLGRLLCSPCRMPPCFTPSCWRRGFHMSHSTRLAGLQCVAAPCRRLSIASGPPSRPPCALLRMTLLPFSPPPAQSLRLLANGPRTPPVLLSKSRWLSTSSSVSMLRPTVVSPAMACRMAPPRPLATTPTPSSPRQPQSQPFALLFTLKRQPHQHPGNRHQRSCARLH